jgi:UDP-2-acetamido-3-amino-2,3-dideoxy-glucuronate N-acetyltransferase
LPTSKRVRQLTNSQARLVGQDSNEIFIHPLADCQSSRIGSGTKVWQFSVVLPGAVIGRNCNINSHCFLENDVVLGDEVTVKCGVYLWDGMRVENRVFIGPNASFTNDRLPRSRQYPKKYAETLIKSRASIGAGAVILPGLTIGVDAMIGAGAVITKNVPDRAIVYGTSARVRRLFKPQVG